MIWWLAAVAAAGPLGPFESAPLEDTGAPPVPACGDVYPYILRELPPSPLYTLVDPSRSYGTETLVDVIAEATVRVAAAWPDADPLRIGDVSLPQGGPFWPHLLHDRGRSADLGLYTGEGRQPTGPGFLLVPPGELDLPRTWTLLQALLDTGRVEFLLLDQGLIDRLVAWLTEERRLDPAEIERIFPAPDTPGLWAMEGIIRHAKHHRDHVHVEIACD
jgi:hypothetical protein